MDNVQLTAGSMRESSKVGEVVKYCYAANATTASDGDSTRPEAHERSRLRNEADSSGRYQRDRRRTESQFHSLICGRLAFDSLSHN